MSKIFDTFDVDYDHVSFRYTASRVKEHVFVDRPDGIGVIQWKGFWEGVKKLYDSDETFDEIIQAAKEYAETNFTSLEEENEELRDDIAKLEMRLAELEK